MVVSAGVAITYDDKILMVHPKGVRPHTHWGVPKGKREPGESIEETACREVQEEVGIKLDPKRVKELPRYVVHYHPANNRSKKAYKKIVVFHLEVSGPGDVGLQQDQVPLAQIKYDENDMARFMTRAEAEERIFWKQRGIIKHVLPKQSANTHVKNGKEKD